MFEIITFRLSTGTDEASFRALDGRVQVEFAYQQPGFIRRSLGRHEDGRWLILQMWTSENAAMAAEAAFASSSLGPPFVAMMDAVIVDRFAGVD